MLYASTGAKARRSRALELLEQVGIPDVEARDLGVDLLRITEQIDAELDGWKVVLNSLALTVLLVGGVGVLSVMLISLGDRRFEIGLRKSLGATDRQIFLQFVLEAMRLSPMEAMR